MYILSGFFPKFMAHIRQTLNSQKGSPPYVSPYTENSSETHLSAYSDSWSSFDQVSRWMALQYENGKKIQLSLAVLLHINYASKWEQQWIV